MMASFSRVKPMMINHSKQMNAKKMEKNNDEGDFIQWIERNDDELWCSNQQPGLLKQSPKDHPYTGSQTGLAGKSSILGCLQAINLH